jgi:hypothetical protein
MLKYYLKNVLQRRFRKAPIGGERRADTERKPHCGNTVRANVCPGREQAGLGRSPTLLALRFATGVLRILQGYFAVLPAVKRPLLGYQRVSCVAGHLYIHITGYIDICR